jgi:TonB family protein
MKRHLVAPLLLIALTSMASSQASMTPPRARVGQSVMAAQITNKVAPVYPPLARQARIQGMVTLTAEINTTGDVTDVQLVSGHPMLAPSAIAAVKQWKYKPYELNGEVVDVETTVTVNFTLIDKPPADGVTGNISTGPQGGAYSGVVAGVPGPVPFPRRIRVSQSVMQSLLVSKVQPEYPADAKDQRIQGEVRLVVTVDKEGNVYKVELISGHPLLAPSAMEAVRQWKYKPYLLNGEPIEVETTVTVNFTLAE